MVAEHGERVPESMHTYSTDNDLRIRIAAVLGILSYLIVEWFPVLGEAVTRIVPFAIDPTAPTLGLTLTVLTVVFSKWVWTLWPVRALRLVQVPDLSGEWSGKIVSSYHEQMDGDPDGTDVQVSIEQSWRKITVEFETDDSRSYSLGASFITSQSDPQLHYHYQSVPKPNAEETMEMHRGSTEIRFIEGDSDESDVLEGSYYTGRGRESYGRIELTRQS